MSITRTTTYSINNLLLNKMNRRNHCFCDNNATVTVEDRSRKDKMSVYRHPDISNVVEYIKDKLYFATCNPGKKEPKSTSDIYFFNIDNELVYNNFYNDFGPLNIACLYRYCCKVHKKLDDPEYKHKQLVHCTSQNEQKRANSAYLISSYAILYLNKSPKEAYRTLVTASELPLKPFRDVSMGPATYTINLLDCLNALYKAASFGFFNFEDFDVVEYEKYEQMRNGDLNWTVPKKFLAFVGPSTEVGTVYHPPECYIDYFTKNGVVAVVRLNRKTYDASRFTKAGIAHHDMFMPDGSVPPRKILNKFLQLAENTTGAIAVHCKAGLGRTGTLIAAYLIKHYRMSAREAIAWVRICRPGSVIGHQQTWLENMETSLMNAGQQYRYKYYGDMDVMLYCKRGIYSIADKLERESSISETDSENKLESRKNHGLSTNKLNKTKLTRILGKLRSIGGTVNSSEEGCTVTRKRDEKYNRKGKVHAMTQGDRLNEIKMKRDRSSANPNSYALNAFEKHDK